MANKMIALFATILLFVLPQGGREKTTVGGAITIDPAATAIIIPDGWTLTCLRIDAEAKTITPYWDCKANPYKK